MQKRSLGLAAVILTLVVAATACGSGGGGGGGAASSGSSGGGGKTRISLSNSYAGNTWRQQMLSVWNQAGNDASSKGLVASAPVVNSNNSASQQASQIQSMILQGSDAIVIDAASTTALNGVIQKACSAGIKVVVFDSLATAPCAYKVAFDYVSYGKYEVDYLAKQLHNQGNLLEIRGIAGTSVDDDIHKGIVQEIKKYPKMKIVGSVHGNWTESIAQKAVSSLLPSLPKVDGVVDQGGDGYGVAQAFTAAGKPLPVIIMGNRQDELQFWHNEHQKNGYNTTSISSQPGVSSIAFWVAQQLVSGASVPKTITVPLLQIPLQQMSTWLKATPKGGVATPYYNLAWTKKLIDSQKKGTKPPAQPPAGSAK